MCDLEVVCMGLLGYFYLVWCGVVCNCCVKCQEVVEMFERCMRSLCNEGGGNQVCSLICCMMGSVGSY